MSDADETAEAAEQHANALRTSSRTKYTSGGERLAMGESLLAFLSFHGALEDGLWAYIFAQGQTPGPWASVLEWLRTDPERPLSDEYVALLRANNQLRNRIAHGEDVAIQGSDVAAYQRIASEILYTYGVAVEQREAAPAPMYSDSVQSDAVYSEEPPPQADDEVPPAEVRSETRRPRRRAREGFPTDWNEWREQAVTQVQRNRRLLMPIAAGLVVFLLLCLTLRGLFGGSDPSPAARQAARPTLPSSLSTSNAATPPPAGTSLANEQATIVPAPNGAAPNGAAPPEGPAVEGVPPTNGGLVVGGRAIVSQQGDQLNLRTQPGTGPNSSVIASLTAGTSLQVLEGPTQSEGRTWWRVRADTVEGWCVGDFLSAQAGP